MSLDLLLAEPGQGCTINTTCFHSFWNSDLKLALSSCPRAPPRLLAEHGYVTTYELGCNMIEVSPSPARWSLPWLCFRSMFLSIELACSRTLCSTFESSDVVEPSQRGQYRRRRIRIAGRQGQTQPMSISMPDQMPTSTKSPAVVSGKVLSLLARAGIDL